VGNNGGGSPIVWAEKNKASILSIFDLFIEGENAEPTGG
jgi:hypothetical protein